MGKRSVEITVTPRQRVILKRVTRSKKAAQQLVERCRVVLLSATGMHNEAQGDDLGVDRQRVRRWRHRWARAMRSLLTAEAAGATDPDLEKLIISVLTYSGAFGAPALAAARAALTAVSPSSASPYGARQSSCPAWPQFNRRRLVMLIRANRFFDYMPDKICSAGPRQQRPTGISLR
jgi:hypothetical protein